MNDPYDPFEKQRYNARGCVGVFLKAEREAMHWSRSKLAAYLRVNRQAIHDWEEGHTDGPSAFHLGLMHAAGFDSHEIVTGGLIIRTIPMCIFNEKYMGNVPHSWLVVLKGAVLKELNSRALSIRAQDEGGQAQ